RDEEAVVGEHAMFWWLAFSKGEAGYCHSARRKLHLPARGGGVRSWWSLPGVGANALNDALLPPHDRGVTCTVSRGAPAGITPSPHGFSSCLASPPISLIFSPSAR